jgi:hypothetical protein
MRQQPVITHTDAESETGPVKEDGRPEGSPIKKEESGDRPDVENDHHNRGQPVHSVVLGDRPNVCDHVFIHNRSNFFDREL